MWMTSLPNGTAFAGRDGTTYDVPTKSVDVPPSDVGLASRNGWTQTATSPWAQPDAPAKPTPKLTAVPKA